MRATARLIRRRPWMMGSPARAGRHSSNRRPRRPGSCAHRARELAAEARAQVQRAGATAGGGGAGGGPRSSSRFGRGVARSGWRHHHRAVHRRGATRAIPTAGSRSRVTRARAGTRCRRPSQAAAAHTHGGRPCRPGGPSISHAASDHTRAHGRLLSARGRARRRSNGRRAASKASENTRFVEAARPRGHAHRRS